MIKASVKREPGNLWPVKKLYSLSKHLTRFLKFGLTVKDGGAEYFFVPAGKGDLNRYLTFFTKEEGTIRWIKDTVKDGDIFFDIGANVGLYSLYAARQANHVTVYAFEPHKYNFVCLVDNISRNGLLPQIFPIAIPLGETNDVFRLNYLSVESGASMTQLGHKKLPDSRDFTPKFEEIVYAAALDELVEKKHIPMPTVIKIDVDGNELPILKGMTKLLSAPDKPRSIQVEINPGQKSQVVAFFAHHGYRHDHSHYTASKKARFAAGASEDDLAHNAVFVKA